MSFEDDFYGDLPAQYLESLRKSKISHSVSGPTVLAYGFLAVTVCYHMMQYFDYPVLPISELAWNIFVYLTPTRVISALDMRTNGTKLGEPPGDYRNSSSRLHAMKSEAVRRIFGLNPEGILGKVKQAHSLPGVGRLLPGKKKNMEDGAPPGLGNWDNSCYQNSVIQGLASLPSLPNYLAHSVPLQGSSSTATALRTIIATLNNPSNVGQMFWTPVELKTMNSWQQQDAQEYFSKVLDEVGKEVLAGQKEKQNLGGLACLSTQQKATAEAYRNVKLENAQFSNIDPPRSLRGIDQLPAEIGSSLVRNPLEGLLAQRVGCLKCGYVEGLSLIPFNCLTVPLGNEWMYDIRSCLDDYTALEPINGVECVKCTLLRNKIRLERLYSQTQDPTQGHHNPLLTQALQASITERKSVVEKALDDNDFSDNAILKKCQIPVSNRVSVTKSRQAVIARAPKSLVIHVNRSVFDEVTGIQCKNFADVKFPPQLDLAPWCLGSQTPRETEAENVEKWSLDPSKSMHSLEAEDMASLAIDDSSPSSQQLYNLRAVITHYGRHENGHYICYRKHGLGGKPSTDLARENSESWWCLSDEEVSSVSENTVLEQGGVFVLFYEKSELAKDVMLSSLKKHDAALPDSSPRPVETTSGTTRVAVDDCVRSETVIADHISCMEKDTVIPIMKEVHDGPFATTSSANNQILEASETRKYTEATNDCPFIASQSSSALISPACTFQQSPKVPSSEDLVREEPAPLENHSLEACSNYLSSRESSSAEPASTQSSSENSLRTEKSPTTDPQDAESSDTIISTNDTNWISLPPEPCRAKPDDPPKESPKPNHHHPMRTASPLSSRGSVSRAGKAMSNVSAMVTAN